jgi:hypothetical protein
MNPICAIEEKATMSEFGAGEGHRRAVEDRGEADDQQQLLEVDRGIGEDGDDDSQEPVGGDLREDAPEQDQDRQRTGAVGVDDPAVDEDGRHLDQERRREEAEDPVLGAVGEGRLAQGLDREGDAAGRVGAEDRGRDRPDQHQERADERVDDHLDRCADPVAGAPGADQEVERHQHQVEAEDEEEQVLSEEAAERRGLAEPEHEEVVAGTVRHLQRRPQGRRRPEQRGQQHQEDADAVDAELEADAELRDPALVDDVLEIPPRRIEAGDQDDRQHERGERPQRRPPAGDAGRQQEADQADGDGDDEDRDQHQDAASRK